MGSCATKTQTEYDFNDIDDCCDFAMDQHSISDPSYNPSANRNAIDNNKLRSFRLGKPLGKGQSCQVSTCQRITPDDDDDMDSDGSDPPHSLAMKQISKDGSYTVHKKCFDTETNVLETLLGYPYFAQLVDAFEDEWNFFIITELCKGGSLFDGIVKQMQFSEKTTALILHTLLRAILRLHTMGIAHRDLKPANIMFKTSGCLPDAILIDFGTSVIFDNKQTLYSDFVGTPLYQSPKVARRESVNMEETKAWDMWSLGMIAYIMLTGNTPFGTALKRNNVTELVSNFTELELPHDCSLSQPCIDFLRRLLTINDKQRYTAKQALSHPWITMNAIPTTNDNISITDASLWTTPIANINSQNVILETIVDRYTKQLSESDTTKLKRLFSSLDSDAKGYLLQSDIERWFTDTHATANLPFSAQTLSQYFLSARDDSETNQILFKDFLYCQTTILFINNPVSVLKSAFSDLPEMKELSLMRMDYDSNSIILDLDFLKMCDLPSAILKEIESIFGSSILNRDSEIELWDFIRIATSPINIRPKFITIVSEIKQLKLTHSNNQQSNKHSNKYSKKRSCSIFDDNSISFLDRIFLDIEIQKSRSVAL